MGIVDFVSTNQPFVFWFEEPFGFGFSFQVHLRDGEIWNGEESVVFEYLLDGFVLFKIVDTKEDLLLFLSGLMITWLFSSSIDERIHQGIKFILSFLAMFALAWSNIPKNNNIIWSWIFKHKFIKLLLCEFNNTVAWSPFKSFNCLLFILSFLFNLGLSCSLARS